MSTAALLAQILVKYGPDMYLAWVEIFHKSEPTKADFLAVLDAIGKETYQGFIDEARAAHGLPPVPAPLQP